MAAWQYFISQSGPFFILLICFSCLLETIAAADLAESASFAGSLQQSKSWAIQFGGFATRIPVLGSLARRQVTVWDMVAVAACCGLVRAWTWDKGRRAQDGDDYTAASNGTDASSTDPGLIKKHSHYKTYTTSFATYPQVRIFFRPHAQADKLPDKPKPLPLLVFVHGLGGSVVQFNNILTSLVNVGPCLAIDLPGCGLSRLAPKDWEAYSHAALVELVSTIIDDIHAQTGAEEVVLIGHSMGCSICVSMISNTSPHATSVKAKTIGLVTICPKATQPDAKQIQTFQKLLSIPSPIFNLWRAWDRRGGTESASVARIVGANAHPETKKLQIRFNEQSKTDTWRRMASGCVPTVGKDGQLHGGLPGPDVWAGISVPLFLIAGEGDNVTKAEELTVIAKALGKDLDNPANNHKISATVAPHAAVDTPGSLEIKPEHSDDDSSPSQTTSVTAVKSRQDSYQSDITFPGSLAKKRTAALKTSTLPKPAGHALLYDHATYRTLSGLIQSFLSSHIDPRLSLGWQLQHLKEANKWDVKNLAKWTGVAPVSRPIAGIFRALKTLREVDDVHSPKSFLEAWGSKIRAVIDISHETPVYNPQVLDDGGVEYHKFPTVSKVPPTAEEVRDFVILVDRLREEKPDERLIGVHCHYGFNRTGFFVCCYLIEREGYTIQRAIDEFQNARPPGIRHEHFLDTLAVRYHKGLKRAPTL